MGLLGGEGLIRDCSGLLGLIGVSRLLRDLQRLPSATRQRLYLASSLSISNRALARASIDVKSSTSWLSVWLGFQHPDPFGWVLVLCVQTRLYMYACVCVCVHACMYECR